MTPKKPNDPKPTASPPPVSVAIALPPDFWKNARQSIFDALRVPQLHPSPARLMTFSVGKVNQMAQTCDVTVGWIPPATGNVKVQHFAATVQFGADPPTSTTEELAAGATSFVLPGVANGAVIQASVIEDNGVLPSPALASSFTVDLSAAPAATGMTFAVGNIQGTPDVPPPAPAPAEPAPAAPPAA
jgi:hypothetical protein